MRVAAAARHWQDALADIYLITPDNQKHGSGFVTGNKVARSPAADAYFRFISSDKMLSRRLHLHAPI